MGCNRRLARPPHPCRRPHKDRPRQRPRSGAALLPCGDRYGSGNCAKVRLLVVPAACAAWYARKMIYTEELHQGDVDKMLRKPGDVSVFSAESRLHFAHGFLLYLIRRESGMARLVMRNSRNFSTSRLPLKIKCFPRISPF